MDRGLIEFLGPQGISTQVYMLTSKISAFNLGFVYYYLFIFIGFLSIFLLIFGG
jgi:hypothetical protein